MPQDKQRERRWGMRLGRRWAGLLGAPLLMMAGLTAAAYGLRQLGLQDAVARVGERGPLGFAVLGAVACTVGVPRQAVAYAGGFAFGFWTGAALAMVAELAGCAVDFWWARWLGRGWARRHLWRWRWAGRLERALVERAFGATLTIRLLPVGSNVALNLLAGVSAVAAGPFLAASAVGFIPQTAVFALMGGGVRVSQAGQVALAVGLMVVSVVLGVVLMRRREADLPA